jgi:formylglycine-generating enzyme
VWSAALRSSNNKKIAAIGAVGVIALVVLAVVLAKVIGREDTTPCSAGFKRIGPRCRAEAPCPQPLHSTDHGCDSLKEDVVFVPATTITIGPSDWEAEGRVKPRTANVAAFVIDKLEVTTGRFCAFRSDASFCQAVRDDPARAAFGVSLAAARSFCASQGGRLPTEDEWLAAAGGEKTTRYPWGDTGAVCRRAAWGLETGPCGEGATGPDSVGAHENGMTPRGIYDLAGNVDEWVEPVEPALGCDPITEPQKCQGIVRGGSYRSRLATELRTWLRREVSGVALSNMGADPAIGFRCAYAPKKEE